MHAHGRYQHLSHIIHVDANVSIFSYIYLLLSSYPSSNLPVRYPTRDQTPACYLLESIRVNPSSQRTWPPPPPSELHFPMAENHAQYHRLFKTCSVVATNYDGSFPFIAFMSRYFQRCYVRPPQAVFHVSFMPKSYHFKDRSQLHPHVPPPLF